MKTLFTFVILFGMISSSEAKVMYPKPSSFQKCISALKGFHIPKDPRAVETMDVRDPVLPFIAVSDDTLIYQGVEPVPVAPGGGSTTRITNLQGTMEVSGQSCRSTRGETTTLSVLKRALESIYEQAKPRGPQQNLQSEFRILVEKQCENLAPSLQKVVREFLAGTQSLKGQKGTKNAAEQGD